MRIPLTVSPVIVFPLETKSFPPFQITLAFNLTDVKLKSVHLTSPTRPPSPANAYAIDDTVIIVFFLTSVA